MGDPACWLGDVCEVCGRIPDGEHALDAEGRCVDCRDRHMDDLDAAAPHDESAPSGGRPPSDS